MKKVLISFGKYAEAALLQISRTALRAITGNAYFTNISPIPADMLTTTDNYESKLAAAATGDRTAIAEKNKAKKELKAHLRSWAVYVNMIADGNAEIAVSSGLPLAKTPEPVQLTAPTNLVITQGINPGSLRINFKKPAGAQGYIIKWTKAPITPASNWQTKGTGVTKNTITGFEEGVKYWFKVEAFGSNEEVAMCNEVSCYVMQRSQEEAA